jgi:hypothetical protein
MALNKDGILNIDDINIKEIEVPVWNDTVFIRQLTRGQQDEYMKRRFGDVEMKQHGRQQNIESNIDLFGHDAWVFAQGVCDEKGERLFTNGEVSKLNEKNGEAIGFVANEIVKFSGMEQDVEDIEQLKN